MLYAHASWPLGLSVQVFAELRLRQSSTAPVHAFIGSKAALGKIGWVGIKLRSMANEIPDVGDLFGLTFCARTPKLVLL